MNPLKDWLQFWLSIAALVVFLLFCAACYRIETMFKIQSSKIEAQRLAIEHNTQLMKEDTETDRKFSKDFFDHLNRTQKQDHETVMELLRSRNELLTVQKRIVETQNNLLLNQAKLLDAIKKLQEKL